MTPLKRQPRRVSTTLVREATDWGISVSEKSMRSTWLNNAFLILSVVVLLCGSLIILPVLVGLLLSAEMTQIGIQVLIVAVFVGVAVHFSLQSRKGPRNALEVDHEAGELRFGFVNRYGAFVRQQVVALKAVKDAYVDTAAEGEPELVVIADAEDIRLALTDAKTDRLGEIASQICEAASRARQAPRRSRVRSAIAGIGASYREIGNRVVSRVYH